MSVKFEPPSESKDEADSCESEPCSKCARTLQLICARCSFVSGLPMHSRSLFILEPELKFQGPHCVHMTDVFYKSMLTVFKHRVLHFWRFECQLERRPDHPVPAEIYLAMSFIIGENLFRCSHREMRQRLYRLMGNVELNGSFNKVLRAVMRLKNTKPVSYQINGNSLRPGHLGLISPSRDLKNLPSDWYSRDRAIKPDSLIVTYFDNLYLTNC